MLTLGDLLAADLEADEPLLIKLDTYYKYEPKDVPTEFLSAYNQEKRTAKGVEDIYHKYRNNSFTKQVQMRFGYFTIHLPISNVSAPDGDDEEEEVPANPLLEETKEISFPLFSMTVEISHESKQFYVTPLGPEFEVNLSALEPVLGDNYLDLVSALGQLEAKGQYQLPKHDEKIFQEIWRLVSGHLGTSAAKFGRESFRFQEKRLSLIAKTNYFLAEDLRKLASTPEEDLLKTSISTWTSDENLSHEDGVPKDSELYFPFAYDRYQLRAVGRLKNKASMIQGPPGCGKSQTISNLLCHLAATKQRVLFVSQKAQALKVVKDRLNELKIPNLYGYIPNPASQSLTKEDEQDGAGPQLARMAAYVQALERRLDQNDDSNKLSPFSAEVNQAKAKLNAQYDLEREICQTHKVIDELAGYEVPCDEPDLLRTMFTAEVWDKLEAAATHLNSVGKEVSELQSTQPERPSQWPGKLALVDFTTASGSEAISELRDYAAEHRYDRRWSLARSFNTMVLKFRNGPALKALPREVLDLVDEVLKSPASRSETVRQLSQLHDEVRLRELQKEYEKLITQFFGQTRMPRESRRTTGKMSWACKPAPERQSRMS